MKYSFLDPEGIPKAPMQSAVLARSYLVVKDEVGCRYEDESKDQADGQHRVGSGGTVGATSTDEKRVEAYHAK